MPDLKRPLGASEFRPSAVDPSSVPYKDKAREKQRQKVGHWGGRLLAPPHDGVLGRSGVSWNEARGGGKVGEVGSGRPTRKSRILPAQATARALSAAFSIQVPCVWPPTCLPLRALCLLRRVCSRSSRRPAATAAPPARRSGPPPSARRWRRWRRRRRRRGCRRPSGGSCR